MTTLACACLIALSVTATAGAWGVLVRGEGLGYQYTNGAYKGSEKFGYVLRSCIRVARWAPNANWNPAP